MHSSFSLLYLCRLINPTTFLVDKQAVLPASDATDLVLLLCIPCTYIIRFIRNFLLTYKEMFTWRVLFKSLNDDADELLDSHTSFGGQIDLKIKQLITAFQWCSFSKRYRSKNEWFTKALHQAYHIISRRNFKWNYQHSNWQCSRDWRTKPAKTFLLRMVLWNLYTVVQSDQFSVQIWALRRTEWWRNRKNSLWQ